MSKIKLMISSKLGSPPPGFQTQCIPDPCVCHLHPFLSSSPTPRSSRHQCPSRGWPRILLILVSLPGLLSPCVSRIIFKTQIHHDASLFKALQTPLVVLKTKAQIPNSVLLMLFTLMSTPVTQCSVSICCLTEFRSERTSPSMLVPRAAPSVCHSLVI